MIIVRYNGGTGSYYGSFSSPSVLRKGCLYEVAIIKEYSSHTEYYLKGIEGKFNSVWFNKVGESVDTAYTRFYPYGSLAGESKLIEFSL
ncbi:MAG: hypothetical protein IKF17_04450 [Clostridia bacterium]|nr:hypothetical protein [Clostridia bacterium]